MGVRRLEAGQRRDEDRSARVSTAPIFSGRKRTNFSVSVRELGNCFTHEFPGLLASLRLSDAFDSVSSMRIYLPFLRLYRKVACANRVCGTCRALLGFFTFCSDAGFMGFDAERTGFRSLCRLLDLVGKQVRMDDG